MDNQIESINFGKSEKFILILIKKSSVTRKNRNADSLASINYGFIIMFATLIFSVDFNCVFLI